MAVRGTGVVRWLFILMAGGGFLFLGASCRVGEPEPPAGNKSEPAPKADIVTERARLDKTVWAKEVEAQKHETPFVELWDKLRAAKDPFAVFEKFPFESIVVGQPGMPSRKENSVEIFAAARAGSRMDRKQWKAWLSHWRSQGFEIVQSEWHHSKFDPDAQPPRSIVSFELHVVNRGRTARYIVRGKLDVRWHKPTSASDTPRVKTIDATDVTILSRRGQPAFRQVAKLELKTTDMPMLMAYDLDGDGRSELVSMDTVYWNRGNWQFEPEALFKHPPAEPMRCGILGDFTGDGNVDLLGIRYHLTLFKGDGNNRFSTPGQLIAGVPRMTDPMAITAGDIDGDGDLDVWIGQYKRAYETGQMPTPYYDANDGFPAFLLRNDGNGKFTDVTESSGLAVKRKRRTYSASFVDLDADGDLDLVVASDYAGLDLYANDGKGKFTDITDSADQRHSFGMALTFSDYDLDSKLDFYMTGMASTTARRLQQLGLGRKEFPKHQVFRTAMAYGNRMLLARGKGFQQAPFNDQIARTGWSWGSTSFDFDNDGDRDIYVANGHISGRTAKDYCTRFWCHDIYTGSSKSENRLHDFFKDLQQNAFEREGQSWNGFEHNALLMNDGGRGFVSAAFLAGAALENDSRCVVSDDLNGDGRPDLVIVAMSPATGPRLFVHVLENTLKNDRNWIAVRMDNLAGNSGATVRVKTPDRTHIAAVVTGDSLRSQHAPFAHFGLGTGKTVTEITIERPGRPTLRIKNPKINQVHHVR